jgi:hypothetical protein
MSLIGTLKGFGVTDIFQLISQQMKTGILILSSGKEEVTVAFRDGVIQGILSDKWDTDPRIDILMKGKFVGEKELKAAYDNQKKGLGNWYEYLISKGKVNDSVLGKASILAFRNKMLDVFRWDEGSYRFSDQDVDTENMLSCNLPTEGVVLDTLRILDEMPLIIPKSPPLDYCPVAIAPLTHETAIRHDLHSIDVVIYNLIDGEKTVDDVINQSLELPADAISSIIKMIESGIVEVFPKGSMEKRDLAIAREETFRRIKVAMVYISLLICIALLIFIGKPRILFNPLSVGKVVSSQINEQKTLSENISKQVKSPSAPGKDGYVR